MDNITFNSENGVCYLGIDWRDIMYSLPIKPNDSIMFCDLRGCSLDSYDLSNVVFFGCRLNGTSFQKSVLFKTQFVGCFSSDDGPVTDFRGSFWMNTDVIDSHLNCLSNQKNSNFWRWPAEVAEAASGILSEQNDIRYEAIDNLGTLNQPLVSPILASSLIDKEWDVRVATLKVLAKLRLDNREFPYNDKLMMEWIFMCLGDNVSFVRHEAIQLVQLLHPSEDILRVSVERIKSNVVEDQLAGLRATAELYKLDKKYLRLLDIQILSNLVINGSPEVRSEVLYLLGILDEPLTISWILNALSDPVASIRIDALLAISRLSNAPPANSMKQLLDDPDEQVRIQFLKTLEDIEDFDFRIVEKALLDPSAEVRNLAQNLLKE